MRLRLTFLVLVVGVAVGGCETDFDPFEESDLRLSLFGFIDAAADTQFVRVADLQNPAFPGESLAATVTLEHLETGNTVTLRDSVFAFANGGFANNVWTPESIASDAAYRLTATTPDGTVASAVFRTPSTFPNPQLDSGIIPFVTSAENPPRLQQMFFEGIERFADLRIRYVLEAGGSTTVSYLDRVVPTEDGGFRLAFNAYEDVQEATTGSAGEGCPGLRAAEVFVAATTDEWPDVLDLDPEILALPSTVTNVEGGLGFIGGVEIRQAPWLAMVGVFGFHQAGCQS